MSTANFYENLTTFKEFKRIAEPVFYQKFPPDWVVVIADVKGSTNAIREGRYRDVNLMGSACITSVLNVCGRQQIPFIFGGDGATLVIPPDQVKTVKNALSSTQNLSQEKFNLELRVGFVPIQLIEQHGKVVSVAKFEVAPGNFMAMFGGGGLALAEQWVKNSGPSGENFNLAKQQSNSATSLEGLSCRWQPLKSQQGQMLSLIVSARGDEIETPIIYQEILLFLEQLLASESLHLSRPVQPSSMLGEGTLKAAERESRINNKSIFSFVFLRVIFEVLVAKVFFRFKLKLGSFGAESYKKEISENTDFRKFDDSLRMVIDCSSVQISEIQKHFDELMKNKKIFYGLHTSPEAIMTCLVFSPFNNQHIHFVDGSHGGYAMAATQLKAQIKTLI